MDQVFAVRQCVRKVPSEWEICILGVYGFREGQ